MERGLPPLDVSDLNTLYGQSKEYDDLFKVCTEWAPLVTYGSLSQLQERSWSCVRSARAPEDMTLEQTASLPSQLTRVMYNAMPSDFTRQALSPLLVLRKGPRGHLRVAIQGPSAGLGCCASRRKHDDDGQ